MLSWLVIAFLSKSKSFNFMSAFTICSDFGAQEYSLSLFSLVPHLFAWSDGTRCRDLIYLYFRMLSFKPAFLLSSFTFIKRFFSFSSLYAIRVVSSAYLSYMSLENKNLSILAYRFKCAHYNHFTGKLSSLAFKIWIPMFCLLLVLVSFVLSFHWPCNLVGFPGSCQIKKLCFFSAEKIRDAKQECLWCFPLYKMHVILSS